MKILVDNSVSLNKLTKIESKIQSFYGNRDELIEFYRVSFII